MQQNSETKKGVDIRISIVIPTYNKSVLLNMVLGRMLREVFGQDSVEIMVVDDGSTDDTRQVLRYWAGKFARLRWIRMDHKGVAAARNLGVLESAGDLIVFLDDDCLCGRGWIRSYLDVAQHGVEHNTAFVGSRVEERVLDAQSVLKQSRRVPSEERYSHLEASWDIVLERACGLDSMIAGSRTRTINPSASRIDHNSYCPWMFFCTFNCAVPRTAFERIEGFDERHAGWGEEDIELAYRLFLDGVKFRAHPSVVLHFAHDYDPELRRDTWIKNYELFARKYRNTAWMARWKYLFGILDFEGYVDLIAASASIGGDDSDVVPSNLVREFEAFCAVANFERLEERGGR